ncbi:MAG: hypothetical protein HXS54_01180 [Theionarchaea archaeon]|nr:hypothetical protein [Theionarchaea archaeon]
MAFLIDVDSFLLIDIIRQLDEENEDNGAALNDIYSLGEEKGLKESFIKSELKKMKYEGDIYSPRPGYLKVFPREYYEFEEEVKEQKSNFKYENGDVHFEIERFFMILSDLEENSAIHSDGNDSIFEDHVEIKSVKFHITNIVRQWNYRSAGEVIFYRSNHKELLKNNGSYIIVVYSYKDGKINIHAVKKISAKVINHFIKKSKSKEKIGIRWTRFFKNVSSIPLFTISESNELIKFRNRQETWLSSLNDYSILQLKVCRRLTEKWNYLSSVKYIIQHRTVLHNEIVFDIDFKKWEDVKEYGEKVIKTLEKLKIPHVLAYSGGKGIHIHVFFKFSEDQNIRLFTENISIDTIFVRMQLFKYILKEAEINDELIGKSKPFDTSCVNFSDELKGHLIRAFGGKKESFKTIIEEIPDDKPTISYDQVIFPTQIEEWILPDELLSQIFEASASKKEVKT